MINWLVRRFVPNCDLVENPKTRGAYGKLAGMVGIAANLILSGCKMTVGAISGSVSILADGINNLSDASASIVTLIGFRLSEKPADEDHPFGHARMEYIAGLAVAALILVIGVELGQASLEKIFNPEAVLFSWVTTAVLAISMAVKAWLMVFNRHLAKKIHSVTLNATAADCRNDILTTGAVLACTLISQFTALELDGYVGLLVAAFIVWSGITIAKDTVDPLLGIAPTPEYSQSLASSLQSYDKVLGVHDLIIHDYGPGRRFVTVHVEMDHREDPLICHEIIDSIERDFLESLQIHLVIHYDPVITDDAELIGVRDTLAAALSKENVTFHDLRLVKAPGHTKVLFDMAVPYELDNQHDRLKALVIVALSHLDATYVPLITFDHVTFNQK